MNSRMTIGTLANLAGVNTETIRFYQKKGLIKEPAKTGGFRYYGPEVAQRIKFIKKCQQLGFTLAEAQDFLDLKLKGQSQCGDVIKKANSKIEQVEQKIKNLKKIKQSLLKLTKYCQTPKASLSDCLILDHLMELE